MLFGAVVARVFGSHRNVGTLTQGFTASEFFGRYPALHALLLARLKAAAAAATGAGAEQRAPPAGLFALLALLARLFPSSQSNDGPDGTAPFVVVLTSCLHSALYQVRSMAARALVPLVPTGCALALAADLLAPLATVAVRTNSADGRLRAVLALVRIQPAAAGAAFVRDQVLPINNAPSVLPVAALYLELLALALRHGANADADLRAILASTASRALAMAGDEKPHKALDRVYAAAVAPAAAALLVRAQPASAPPQLISDLRPDVRLEALTALQGTDPVNAAAVAAVVDVAAGPNGDPACVAAAIRLLTRWGPSALSAAQRARLWPVTAERLRDPATALSVRCAALPLLSALGGADVRAAAGTGAPSASPLQAVVAAVLHAAQDDQVRGLQCGIIVRC